MLRFLFPLISLAIASLSICVELYPRAADSRLCLSGFCRFDQILASDATPATVSALLNENSGDPGIWCTYGEFWGARGETAKAKAAFDRALVLGSGLSDVLMRTANFDFTHDRKDDGLRLVPRILSQTNNFDGILFSYLRMSGEPVSRLLGTAVPPLPRAADSWLVWLRSQGSNQDILSTWTWMRRLDIAGEQSAADTAWTLWNRKAYKDAQELWVIWLGARQGDYLKPQLLTNTRFQQTPSGSPFDWNFDRTKSVEFTRRDGLDIHFLGEENIDSVGIQQFTAPQAGRYTFSAEVSGNNITTDEGPFFKITDVENPERLSVQTRPITGTRCRSWISADFTVPAATRGLEVQLTRRSSFRFDNKIAGTLHIYQTSLVPLRGRS
jgi:hypothetical protein